MCVYVCASESIKQRDKGLKEKRKGDKEVEDVRGEVSVRGKKNTALNSSFLLTEAQIQVG